MSLVSWCLALDFGIPVPALPDSDYGHVPMSSPSCNIEGCDEQSVWRVNGQWSLADWDWYDTCDVHLDDGIRALERRTVDGQKCLEITFDWMGRYG